MVNPLIHPLKTKKLIESQVTLTIVNVIVKAIWFSPKIISLLTINPKFSHSDNFWVDISIVQNTFCLSIYYLKVIQELIKSNYLSLTSNYAASKKSLYRWNCC